MLEGSLLSRKQRGEKKPKAAGNSVRAVGGKNEQAKGPLSMCKSSIKDTAE